MSRRVRPCGRPPGEASFPHHPSLTWKTEAAESIHRSWNQRWGLGEAAAARAVHSNSPGRPWLPSSRTDVEPGAFQRGTSILENPRRPSAPTTASALFGGTWPVRGHHEACSWSNPFAGCPRDRQSAIAGKQPAWSFVRPPVVSSPISWATLALAPCGCAQLGPYTVAPRVPASACRTQASPAFSAGLASVSSS